MDHLGEISIFSVLTGMKPDKSFWVAAQAIIVPLSVHNFLEGTNTSTPNSFDNATKLARINRFEATPPTRAILLSPVFFKASLHLVIKISEIVNSRLDAMFFFVSGSLRSFFFVWVSTAVFKPEKLKSRVSLLQRGFGNLNLYLFPLSASSEIAGPPG